MKIPSQIRSLFWIALVISVLILSWLGLSQLYPETNTLRYLPDRIFRLLKTLMGNDPMGSGVEPEGIPRTLIAAKILVTVILLRALLKVVEKVFHEQYTQLRIAFKKGHTIVIGIGNKGSRILKDHQAQSGQTAVAVEQKADHKNLSALRRDGHAVIIGNAADSEVLCAAGALKAHNVICFSNNAQTGMQIAARLTELYAHKQPSHVLRCFVHVDHPQLVDAFCRHGQAQAEQGGVSVRFFNLHKMIARHFFHCLPQQLAAQLRNPQAHIRFLLIGFDTTAQALLRQALRVFHLLPGQHSEWRVLVPNAARAAARFNDRHPLAQHITTIAFHEDNGCPTQWMRDHGSDLPAHGSLVVLCAAADDGRNLITAADLLNASAGQHFPIYVLNSDGKGMCHLLDGEARERLHFFGDYDDFCRYELITAARQDRLAQAIHRDYLSQIGGTASESAAYQSAWDSLSEDGKDANRAQADHIIYKLMLTGKQHALRQTQTLTFNAAEVEQLAITEHHRWAAHRYLNGWNYGEVRDDARKQHPSLVAWDALSEAEKHKDRATVLRLSEIVRTADDINL